MHQNLPIMKALYFFACLALISVVFLKFGSVNKKENLYDAKQKIEAYKKRAVIGCAPNLASIDFSDPANSIPMLMDGAVIKCRSQ